MIGENQNSKNLFHDLKGVFDYRAGITTGIQGRHGPPVNHVTNAPGLSVTMLFYFHRGILGGRGFYNGMPSRADRAGLLLHLGRWDRVTMLLKIFFSRRFNDHVQGLFKIKGKMPKRLDDFRP